MYIYLFGCHMGSLVIYQLTFLCMCPISQSLLLQDQLTKEILKGNVFCGFSEQPINFQPSYKFDINTNNYDTSEKQRIPSWTVSLHPFIHPPTHPFIHPPTHPFIHPHIHLSIHPHIHLSTHTSIFPSTHTSTHLSIYNSCCDL